MGVYSKCTENLPQYDKTIYQKYRLFVKITVQDLIISPMTCVLQFHAAHRASACKLQHRAEVVALNGERFKLGEKEKNNQ